MVEQTSIADELATLAGQENILDPQAFAVDGMYPRAAVAPGSYDSVAALLRYANGERLAVIPWGGGKHMAAGNIPQRYDIALDLARFNAVVEHEPADLTVTIGAGMTLGALRAHMALVGQVVPFDPAVPDSATVGGALAANAFGAYRHAWGTARDFTIGLRVVTADGRLTRAGGRVVKNVAGYDMCKLYIGSLGTLGVIVEATFKVLPLPEVGRELAVTFPAAAPACAAASAMYRRGLAARSFWLRPEGAAWLLRVAVAGSPKGVLRSTKEARSIATEAGGAPKKDLRPVPEGAPRELSARVSVMPSRLAALLEDLASLPGPALEAYPTLGIVRIRGDAASLDALRAVATQNGGALVIEACPAELKREIDVFGEAPAALELMRQLKQQFDPNGVLSPGRFVGRI